jgi:hypothetical protein
MNLKINLKKCLVALGAVAAISAVLVMTNASAINASVLSWGEDPWDGAAWVTSTTVSVTGGTGSAFIADTQAANTRYVIKTVSVLCNVPIGSSVDAGLVTNFNNTTTKLTYEYIPLTFQGNYNGVARWVATSEVTLYNDAAQGKIFAGADTTAGTGTCNFSLSGYIYP